MWWGGGKGDRQDENDGDSLPPLEILAEDEDEFSPDLSPRSTGSSPAVRIPGGSGR